MNIEEKIDAYLNEKKEYLFKSDKGEEGFFVVTKRNVKDMEGKQDKFSMFIINSEDDIVKDLGSHPSLEGAKKFGKSRGYK